MQAIRNKRAVLGLIAAVLVLVAGTAWWMILPGATHTEYCAVCACERQTQQWTLRGSERVLWTRQAETSTMISTVLTGRKLVGAHTHSWVEPRVVPNPLSPYYGPVRLSLGFINTPLVAAMLTNVAEYADSQSAAHVRDVVLAPEYSYLINHDLRFHKFPPRGFHNRLQFLGWWQQNAFSFFDHLRDETVPD